MLGAVMGLLVPVIAALLPVFNGTRVTVLDALTDLGISGAWGKRRLSRLIGRLPLPINVRQALSNVAQKKGRLLLTVITLMLAASAFMGVLRCSPSCRVRSTNCSRRSGMRSAVLPTEAQDFDTVSQLITRYRRRKRSAARRRGSRSASWTLAGRRSRSARKTAKTWIRSVSIPRRKCWKFTYIEGNGWQDDPGPDRDRDHQRRREIAG